MTSKSCNPEPWNPARYLKEYSFYRRPLILGEAPSPTAPDSPWSAGAKSTHNLVALIYGTSGSHSDLVRDFELSNVSESHPGKSKSGFSKFDRLPGASTLQQLSGDGAFHNRVTFFMGRRVSQALASTDSFEQAIDRRSKLKFKPAAGWIDWVPVESSPNSFGLFMMVPHPQAYFRYGDGNLTELSRLFRLALGLSPVSKLGAFRSR